MMIALLISWLVSVTVTPLLGYKLVKPKHKAEENHDIYDTKFYRLFPASLTWCLQHKKMVLSITLACFIGSIFIKVCKTGVFPAFLFARSSLLK